MICYSYFNIIIFQTSHHFLTPRNLVFVHIIFLIAKTLNPFSCVFRSRSVVVLNFPLLSSVMSSPVQAVRQTKIDKALSQVRPGYDFPQHKHPVRPAGV